MIKGEPKMSDEEVVAEIEWMLAFGVHPQQIVSALKMHWTGLEKRLRRIGRKDLANIISTAYGPEKWARRTAKTTVAA